MSANNKKSVRISKVTPKGLKDIFALIGQKIFSKIHKNEVEYGQTLSKKRRKNCVLKSVSSLPSPEESQFLIHSPYHINFEFTKNDNFFRGSVANFQKIDIEESCCEKCFHISRKGVSLSRFSISSDSACDVSSESSCDDEYCKYRKSIPKSKKRLKMKSKSAGDITRCKSSTVENFIRIHNKTFNGVDESTHESNENLQNTLLEWTSDEPKYESLFSKSEEKKRIQDDSDYDILVTKANYRVLEPSYENLKLIESFYEIPHSKESQGKNEEAQPEGNPQEVLNSYKTYDEVIESLKLWHLNSRCLQENCQNCVRCEENLEDYLNWVEGYESLENDFNNDIEEFCC